METIGKLADTSMAMPYYNNEAHIDLARILQPSQLLLYSYCKRN